MGFYSLKKDPILSNLLSLTKEFHLIVSSVHIHVYHLMILYVMYVTSPSRHKTRDALDRAIHNVCKHYSIVGYLENMEDFLGAVEYLYPKYFRGAPDIYNSKGTENLILVCMHQALNTHLIL